LRSDVIHVHRVEILALPVAEAVGFVPLPIFRANAPAIVDLRAHPRLWAAGVAAPAFPLASRLRANGSVSAPAPPCATMFPMELSGGCLCGAVRYRVSSDPLMVFYCHCRDCQRHGGSLLHYGVMVPEAAMKLEGELASFESSSDSGRKITRRFCPTCGTGILNVLELAPGMVVLKGGTLDDEATRPRPSFEVYARSRSAWVATTEVKSFPEQIDGPPAGLRWKP
jgi:hypothetical protein